MPTTWGGIRRLSYGIWLCLGLQLQGCVSDTVFTRPGADPKQIEADANNCADAEPVIAGMVAGAAFGGLTGAAASQAGADAGGAVVLGILIGGLFGLTAGIIGYHGGDAYDRCMAAKGYHRA